VTLIAVGMTIALAASGVAMAKPHGDGHPGNGHGKGGHHGDDGGGYGGDRDRGGGNGKGGGNGRGRAECDAAVVDAVRAAVDAACPCAGTDDGSGGVTPWRNHGRYVRCVAHAVRDELRAAGLKRRCLRGAVPCAAQSACGKRGAAPCVTTTPDTCVGGACSGDPTRLCAIDADCVVLACRVRNPDDCSAAGGVVRTESCCFGSASGAFVDGAEAF
jgi:hypothetical protein